MIDDIFGTGLSFYEKNHISLVEVKVILGGIQFEIEFADVCEKK